MQIGGERTEGGVGEREREGERERRQHAEKGEADRRAPEAGVAKSPAQEANNKEEDKREGEERKSQGWWTSKKGYARESRGKVKEGGQGARRGPNRTEDRDKTPKRPTPRNANQGCGGRQTGEAERGVSGEEW